MNLGQSWQRIKVIYVHILLTPNLILNVTRQHDRGVLAQVLTMTDVAESEKKVIIIIMMIALKGAVRDFYSISSLRRELSPTCTLKWPQRNRMQITCNSSNAYHVQHVGQLSY